MFFGWLKQYMPRGLYMRGALILLLPVLTIQLLVSVVFIQRHFEGVTDQMVDAVGIELRFIADLANQENTQDSAMSNILAIAEPLEMDVAWVEEVPEIGNDRQWTDFTGNSVRAYLLSEVPEISEISLANPRIVTVWMETPAGILQLSFLRKRVSASNPHQLLVIMVILGGLMTLIAYFFLRNQLRPIKRMADAAQAFGKGQKLDYSPSGAVEVRAAGAAFLDMRNRIERQTQNRTMMLSGVSHDLRTPLTRLRLGLSMLDSEEAAPMIADVDEMQYLLDGFLDFARSSSADELELADPHELVREAVSKAQRANMNVTLGESEGATDSTKLRPAAISRALDNLCNNALRYGTQAEVSAVITDKAIRFIVEDNGPGIPVDQREAALRPFERLDPSRNQDKGSGVGLGLTIVNDVARTHGGLLRLGDSEKLGGLKAEIVLPR
ncbi:two-component system, OmpR family, osmolarity sensor histidine kinase EnvZ [Cognatiyoonia sediminum]|uniref:histidine kinase n=1 Tax=Cognatiyoonia sediminum TaxID=1508389 RepID=A0A1M5MD49_9RHOB|nr:ATP-binding protein [Cognatiyoonia sediminum]SHG75112.1 two-component system, OmpR family, osmolarity sensor histidine kinase EnvZ [Cognatiyoonia sediminum]